MQRENVSANRRWTHTQLHKHDAHTSARGVSNGTVTKHLPNQNTCREWWTLTSREMMPALRALLPRTKENSLTWASPAATIHLMYWLVFGKRRDKTSAARTNCESARVIA